MKLKLVSHLRSKYFSRVRFEEDEEHFLLGDELKEDILNKLFRQAPPDALFDRVCEQIFKGVHIDGETFYTYFEAAASK
jgi:hypothetical protein